MRLRHRWGVLLGLLPLLGAPACRSGTARGPDQPAVIPPIAEIGGIRVGYSTSDETDGRFGPGLETIGGHPNSGRLWRVKGTAWTLQTDAFEWSDRGMVLDEFSLATAASDVVLARGQADGYPETLLSEREFRFLGNIRLGDSREAVLHKAAWLPPTTVTATNLVWKATGHYRGKTTTFRNWSAVLEFRDDKLAEISIDARYEYDHLVPQ